MIDCHVHSDYSADSKMKIESACSATIFKRLDGLCITDHLDIDYPLQPDFSPNLPDYSNIPNFLDIRAEISRCKKIFADKIKILFGIEVGIQSHVLNETMEIVNSHDFDSILLSVHVVDKKDPYYSQFYENVSIKQACEKYFEKIVYALNNFDNFDILAHIDYIRRYLPQYELNGDNQKIKELYYADYSDYFDVILKKLAMSGKALELNTGGFRYNIFPKLTDENIFKRFKEFGGEYVTLGSDAHTIDNIGDGFEVAIQFLQNAGFKYITFYEKRVPITEIM